MLDLGTLTVAMGMQTEMPKVRDEAQCGELFNNSEAEATTPSILSGVAAAVEGTLQVFENIAGDVVSAINPAPIASSVLEAYAEGVPSIDLSIPTTVETK